MIWVVLIHWSEIQKAARKAVLAQKLILNQHYASDEVFLRFNGCCTTIKSWAINKFCDIYLLKTDNHFQREQITV